MNKKLLDTIKRLSDVESFKDVCHQQAQNHPMPSVDVLGEIVQLIRAILFPGYFGNANVNSNTMLYHIRCECGKIAFMLSQSDKSRYVFRFAR
jgi:serine O-acetyltransferase